MDMPTRMVNEIEEQPFEEDVDARLEPMEKQLISADHG